MTIMDVCPKCGQPGEMEISPLFMWTNGDADHDMICAECAMSEIEMMEFIDADADTPADFRQGPNL